MSVVRLLKSAVPLQSHLRNINVYEFEKVIAYEIPIVLPAEVPGFRYQVIRTPQSLEIFALKYDRKNSPLLQKENVNYILPREAPSVLPFA